MGRTTYTHTFECNPGSIGTIKTVSVKVDPDMYDNYVGNEIDLKILIPNPGVKFSVSGTHKLYTTPDSLLYPKDPETTDLFDYNHLQPLFPNDYRKQQLLGHTADTTEEYTDLDKFSGGLILGCEYDTYYESESITENKTFTESETFITLSQDVEDIEFHLEIVNEDLTESNSKKLYYDWRCTRTLG